MVQTVSEQKKFLNLIKNRNKAILTHTKKILDAVQPALDGIQAYLEKNEDIKKDEKLVWSQIIPVAQDMFFLLGIVLTEDEDKQQIELPVRVAVPLDVLLTKDPKDIVKFLEEQASLEDKVVETGLGDMFAGINVVDKKKLN